MGKTFGWLVALACLLAAVSPGTAQETGSPSTVAGDPRLGENLYIGVVSFANGGAPCLACHGVAGHGLAGGASYGVDLSDAVATYGIEDFQLLLEEMPFPSMEPIYAGRPLTAEERLHVTAFLAEVSGVAPQAAGPFLAEGVIGAAVLFAVIVAFGRQRLRGVRGELVGQIRRQFGGQAR